MSITQVYDVQPSQNVRCPHQWVVTEWLHYADTDNTYRQLTDFRPMVANVSRQTAIGWTCSVCGEKKQDKEVISKDESLPELDF